MSQSTNALIKEASNHLSLKDIILYESEFCRPDEPEPNEDEGLQQHRRSAQYFVNEISSKSDKEKLVQFHVSLGTRVVRDNGDDEEPDVYFFIEAEYIVEYILSNELSEEALKAFADYNAIHNVWPFWREHVFNIVQKARLPKLDIPLFAGIEL